MKETIYKLSGGVSITIALIADTHNIKPAQILISLSSHRPDIIAITGDLLIGYRPSDDEPIVSKQKNVMRLVSGCVDIAPTYISLGNHEWMISNSDIALLESTGAFVLDNRFVTHTCGNSERITVAGLTSAIVTNYQQFREKSYAEGTDLSRYPYRKGRPNGVHMIPETAWLEKLEKKQGYRILLSHHPEYWRLGEPMLCEHPIDLILSGHAHGGQVRVFNQGLYAPGQGLLPQYTSGVFEGEYGVMVVSCGLANTAGVPRVFNEPEIVYVEVEKA